MLMCTGGGRAQFAANDWVIDVYRRWTSSVVRLLMCTGGGRAQLCSC